MPRVPRDFRSEVAQSTPNTLVASARTYSASSAKKLIRKGRRANSRAWQEALWGYYDTVPEYRSGCDWVGNSLSRARLAVYYKGQPTQDQLALDALYSLFGGPEGQEEMLRLLGINYSVAGEAFLVGSPSKEGPSEPDDWRVVASVEVQGTSTGTNITVEGEDLAPDELAIRIWKAHARLGDEANSPSRAVLPILAEVEKLTQVIDAQADSRLTSAGILWVPSEMELPTVTITTGQDNGEESSNVELDGADGLYNQLVQIASIAIEKRDSAAAKVPIVISAPGEFLEKIQHTEFWSGFDEHVKTLRDEAIRRIAVGLDMPPEVLTGTAEVNHWGAWQIEEASIKQYTEPLLNLITTSLSKGYLRPVLKAWGVKDPENYAFHADTAQMRLRPNRSKEAVELWDRGVLNTRTMLVENGFDPEVDGMSAEERQIWLLLKVAGGSATPDQVAAALSQLGVQNMPTGTEEVLQQVREARPARSLEEHPSNDPPNPEDSEAADALIASGRAAVVDGLVYATEQMVWRALERAGNRLKAKLGRGAAEKVTTDALEMYLTVPELKLDECESLLEDAWGRLDRFSYPGVSRFALERALHSYTLTLLRLQKPYSRASLARHLMLEMAEVDS